MLLKFDIIWTKISQKEIISIFLEHFVHLKWYNILWNTLYISLHLPVFNTRNSE